MYMLLQWYYPFFSIMLEQQKAAKKIYSYFDDAGYKKLSKLNLEKGKKRCTHFSCWLPGATARIGAKFCVAATTRTGQEKYDWEGIFSGTTSELKVFVGFQTNGNCKRNCPYLTKNYGSDRKSVSEITTGEDMIAITFKMIDTEKCMTMDISWKGLTSRRFSLYVTM